MGTTTGPTTPPAAAGTYPTAIQQPGTTVQYVVQPIASNTNEGGGSVNAVPAVQMMPQTQIIQINEAPQATTATVGAAAQLWPGAVAGSEQNTDGAPPPSYE